MKIGILSVVVGLLFALSACASSVPSGFHHDQQGKLVENMPTVQNDKFSPVATVVGLSQFDNPFGGIAKQWFLRSFVDKKTGVVTHQLYLTIDYLGDWISLDLASTDQAQPLELTPIDTNVGDCSLGSCDLSETIGLTINDAFLRDRVKTGFQVKLTGKSGISFVIDITPGMISKQLIIVDRLKNGAAS